MIELLQEHFVQNALIAGVIVAVTAGLIGTFVVLRKMSFAVHATSELGFTGAAGALVIGAPPVLGLIGGGVIVAFILGALTVRKSERDAAIGAFLSFGLGLGVLLVSLYQGYATKATSLLFGSIVGVSDFQVAILGATAAIAAASCLAMWRKLLFATIDPEVAEARGINLNRLAVAFLLMLALTAAAAIQVVGVLLILTLVVTPAAAAQHIAKSPAQMALLAITFAEVATVGGILLSLQWPHPTSFYISTISFAIYLLCQLKSRFC